MTLCLGIMAVLGIGTGRISSDATPDETFARLLAAAQADPTAADYTALRWAYLHTSRGDAGVRPEPDLTPVEYEWKNGERAAARVALDRILDGYWTDIRAHQAAAELAERWNDPARSNLHRTFERGLLDSILASGDGRSFATAWRIATLAEEQAVLAHLRLSGGMRTLVEHEGRHYAVTRFRDERIGRELAVYFDIETAWQAQRRRDGFAADRRGREP
jgi:hypothetical protein